MKRHDMTAPPGPATPRDLLRQYHAQYDADVLSGKFQPFVYPWAAYGALVVVVYLLIPHRDSVPLRRARLLVWAAMAWFSAYCIRYCRCRSIAPAYGMGIVSAWAAVWCAALLVANDAQTDFRRIERTGSADAYAGNSANSGIASRANGFTESEEKGSQTFANVMPPNATSSIPESVKTAKLCSQSGPSKRYGSFAWQAYPISPFIERLDWVLDTLSSFRGVGWNWRISGLPPAPVWVQKQLQGNSRSEKSLEDTSTGYDGTQRYPTLNGLLRVNVILFFYGYMLLDILKVLMMHDRYFWGIMDSTPPPYLPRLIKNSPFLLRLWRLALTQLMVKTALETLFSLSPIFFAGVLGPKWIGARGEPWMYPDTWGSYRNVLNKGLAGWWGGWWHQTFRFAFSEPSRCIVSILGMNPRSLPAKGLQLIIAFSLSGAIHACGSYTLPGVTRPLRGPFLFFVLQSFGILAEIMLTNFVKKIGLQQHIPKLIRQLFTLLYVHVWFWFTAPLLCDDFASGGLWLFEPVPISPLRAFGFGLPGDDWWCLGGKWFRWYHASHWWNSGIAL